MKNVFQGSGIICVLAGFLYLANANAAGQSHDLPEWVVDQSNYEKCAVGVAASGAVNPAEVAMQAGVLELGMMQLVKVDGVEKSFSEKSVIKNVKQLNRVTRLLAETSAEKVTELKNWKSNSGDYFALVCISDKGQSRAPVAGIIKSFIEENEINSSSEINQSLVMSINSTTQMDVVDEFSYIGNKSRWLAQVSNEADELEGTYNSEDGGEYVSVSVAVMKVYNRQLAQAYLQVLAQSRHALANKLKLKVRDALKRATQEIADQSDNAAEVVPGNVSKSIASDVLKNTLVEKVYYDKLDGSMYMIMTHRFSDQDIRKKVERNIKANKELWQKYQASIK